MRSLTTATKTFQSTLPVRGATGIAVEMADCLINFNPRSPCGERPLRITVKDMAYEFQSTLPVRGATMVGCGDNHGVEISIHAPRAGSD